MQEIERIGKAFYDILRKFEDEDRSTRQKRIKFYKKLDYFWHGIQYLLSDGEYSFLSSEELNQDEFDDISYYTKVYNIFKAHGESIIAALSVDYPSILFPPDDAENPDDVETSRAYYDIADLIRKQNSGKLLLIKSLFYLYTAGLVTALNYSEESEEYGTYDVPIYKSEKIKLCPDCRMSMNGTCPECGYSGPGGESEVQSLDRMETKEKSRQLISLHTPLEVFIPSWVKCTRNIPIIRLSDDIHVCQAKYLYTDIADDIREQEDPDPWEAWGRKPFDIH